MCRKVILFVLTLALVSNSYGFVVQNFEYNLDGCSIKPTSTAMVGFSTKGVTSGSYSLKVVTDESWWNEFLVIDLCKIPGAVDAFFANTKFTIDITRLATETDPRYQWVDRGQWWGQDHQVKVLLNPSDVIPPGGTNWWQLDWEGSWGNAIWSNNWAGPSGDQTLTLSWDYSAYKGTIDPLTTELKLILVDEYFNYFPGGIFYLDNAQLIPEPTTIALLSLGGLALLRKRR